MPKASPVSGGKMRSVSSLFWRRAPMHAPSELGLTASCRTIRSSFGFLNPEGLAGLRGLSVSLSMDPGEGKLPADAFIFTVRHGDCRNYPGYISFEFDPAADRIYCDYLFPNLPSQQGLGMTLFTLMLTRANAFAGKTVELRSVWRDSRKMTLRMRDFTPQTAQEESLNNERNITLHVPFVKKDVSEAIEWYWRNILHL